MLQFYVDHFLIASIFLVNYVFVFRHLTSAFAVAGLTHSSLRCRPVLNQNADKEYFATCSILLNIRSVLYTLCEQVKFFEARC